MIKNLIFWIGVFFLLFSVEGIALNKAAGAVYELQSFVNKAGKHSKNVIWLNKFRVFLANNCKKMRPVICNAQPAQYQQECRTGVLSFYNECIGLKNTISDMICCLKKSKQPACKQALKNCPYLKYMYNTDVGMIKYYLKPFNPISRF